MTPYLVGPLAVAGAAALWLAVQRAWLRSFPGEGPAVDALAGRPGCGGCGGCDAPTHPTPDRSRPCARDADGGRAQPENQEEVRS